MSKLPYYFVLEDGKSRKPTKDEHIAMLSFQDMIKEYEKLKYMIDKCTHPVLYDVSGYTYNDRKCAFCGRIVDKL